LPEVTEVSASISVRGGDLAAAIEQKGSESAQPAALPAAPEPPARPGGRGLWPDIVALAKYLSQTEVHTYAFSVAANAILSIFPFIVMLFTLARQIFHSPKMVDTIGGMLHDVLPSNQDFVVRNMSLLAHPRGSVQLASVVTLLISSTGVFLPLEVALNRVWGVKKNRSYVMNQAVSLGVAFAIGLLALACVVLATMQTGILDVLFFGHTDNVVYGFIHHVFLQIAVAVLGVGIFFIIYWVLPHRRLPMRAVLPTAVVMGLTWDLGRLVYILVLPHLDLHSVYGPFEVSVSLMIWAFLTGLLLLAGAQYSATRHALKLARAADREAGRNGQSPVASPQTPVVS
jgi:YihY family inner membrane protein